MESERQLDLESIKTHKNDLIRKLAYLNGKRDELTEMLKMDDAFIPEYNRMLRESKKEGKIVAKP